MGVVDQAKCASRCGLASATSVAAGRRHSVIAIPPGERRRRGDRPRWAARSPGTSATQFLTLTRTPSASASARVRPRPGHTGLGDGAAVRHGPDASSPNRRAAGRGAPGGPDAPALAGRAGRPGAPARRGVGAARRDRDRRAPLGDPLRAAGLREDHPGEDHRHRVPRGLRGGLGGERGAGRGPGGDRAGGGAPPGRGRADDLLPRRDPPLQQGPAGRAAAGGRGGAGDADRGDDREPLLRGQLGAALTLPDLRAARARAAATFAACWTGRSPIPSGGSPSRPRSTRRGAGAARRRGRAATRGWRSRRSSARSRPHAAGSRAVDLDDRRGRAAAQGAQLRPRRRPPLRLRLGLDQGHPGLGPRRLALLPGGDAGGRRGPALHRPADGDPGLRGRRQRRPAGARGRHAAAAAVDRVGLPECRLNLAQAAAYLALAPKSNASYRGHPARHGPRPRARRQAAARLPARRPLPGRTQAGPRDRLRLPARRAGRRRRPAADAGGPRGRALLRADRPRASRPSCGAGWTRSRRLGRPAPAETGDFAD